jgi:nucleoside-diphosphate-sugar epimerase
MAAKLNVVTGATGLLGSHIAEQLVGRGEEVRALVRPTSDTGFLQSLGAEIITCDLQDLQAVRRAVAGADTLYHCAARLGEWGGWKLFRAETVDATRNVVQACRDQGVERVLHVSSVLVYGHRPSIPPGGITEEHPYQSRFHLWTHYGWSKVLAEKAARGVDPNVTIVRPTWIFGPRDRNVLPRLIQTLRAGWVSVVGRGDNLVNMVHASDVAEGAILAATNPRARGRTYHLCSAGEVTQVEFLNALADAIGSPHPRKHIRFRLAFLSGLMLEIVAHTARWRRAPLISRHTVCLMGRPSLYRINKARNELGWEPRIGILESLPGVVEWIREHDPNYHLGLPSRY